MLVKAPTIVGQNSNIETNLNWENTNLSWEISVKVGVLTNTKKVKNMQPKRTTVENLGRDLDLDPDKPLNVYQGRSKVRLKNEFVMVFLENFERLLMVLKKNELRVLIAILRFLEYQNVLKITQASIAHELKMDTGDVSKAYKRLKKLNILSANQYGVEYINPMVFAKGGLLETKEDLNQFKLVFNEENLETDQIQNPYK